MVDQYPTAELRERVREHYAAAATATTGTASCCEGCSCGPVDIAEPGTAAVFLGDADALDAGRPEHQGSLLSGVPGRMQAVWLRHVTGERAESLNGKPSARCVRLGSNRSSRTPASTLVGNPAAHFAAPSGTPGRPPSEAVSAGADLAVPSGTPRLDACPRPKRSQPCARPDWSRWKVHKGQTVHSDHVSPELHLVPLRTTLGRQRNPAVDGLGRRQLRQRADGELLVHPEDRAGVP
jgi:hypothetical protein